MIPYLIYGGEELSIGLLILGVFFFFGFLVLGLWVPGGGHKSEHAIGMIKFGYQLFAIGVVGFLFSSWLLILAIIGTLGYLLYAFFKGIAILRNK